MTETYILDTAIFENPKVFSAAKSVMPEYRRKKIEEYRFPRDQYLSLGAGILLFCGLRRYGIRPEEQEIHYGRNGKPYIEGRDAVHFNLSHSLQRAVCSFSSREVGTDIEAVAAVSPVLIRRICTAAEQVYLSSVGEERRQEEFFRIWTIKESYMKMRGAGFAIAMDSLEVSLGDTVTVRESGSRRQAFAKEYPEAGYRLTVCSEENHFASETIQVSENWIV